MFFDFLAGAVAERQRFAEADVSKEGSRVVVLSTGKGEREGWRRAHGRDTLFASLGCPRSKLRGAAVVCALRSKTPSTSSIFCYLCEHILLPLRFPDCLAVCVCAPCGGSMACSASFCVLGFPTAIRRASRSICWRSQPAAHRQAVVGVLAYTIKFPEV